jgi:hypothetical protein
MTRDFWKGWFWASVTIGVVTAIVGSLTACTTPQPLPEPHGPVYLTNPSAIRSTRCEGRFKPEWCEPSR